MPDNNDDDTRYGLPSLSYLGAMAECGKQESYEALVSGLVEHMHRKGHSFAALPTVTAIIAGAIEDRENDPYASKAEAAHRDFTNSDDED